MLDNLYSLRQRVREAESMRSKLRESILRHRGEQEQLQIRMDAERDAHDENRKLLAVSSVHPQMTSCCITQDGLVLTEIH